MGLAVGDPRRLTVQAGLRDALAIGQIKAWFQPIASLRTGTVVGHEALAHLGVSWWVDDFGTGFSSISHLRDLPVQGLNLDRPFTAAVEEGDQRSLRLAQGLVGLARGLALETVAEGVETDVQADILLGQGWSMGQGWYFGRPAPLDHVG